MAQTATGQQTSQTYQPEPEKPETGEARPSTKSVAAASKPKRTRRRRSKSAATTRLLEERTLGKLSVLQVQLEATKEKKNIKTLVYLPGRFTPDMPVGIIMHGITRDAWSYMESWVGLAEQYGFVLVVPEFSKTSWRTTYAYNLGNVRDRSGKDRASREWGFTALDTVFDAVRDQFSLDAERFYIYGHSAGAQFVHRYFLHTGAARVERAVASNAGWYMLPSDAFAFPYGISDLKIGEKTLKDALDTPLTVLLGERDDDPNSIDLRSTAEAMAQGPHRLARGLSFVEVAQSAAIGLDCAFRWHSRIVPRIGHSDRSMAPYACAALFGPSPRP